jgi:hypothetical protein
VSEQEQSVEDLERYRRAMAEQYEADAADASETFLQEFQDWKAIRGAAVVRSLQTSAPDEV